MTTLEPPLPIAYPEQPNPPSRPLLYCEDTMRAVAKELLAEVITWLGSDFKPGQEGEIEEQLAEALDRAWDLDGFKIAKRLADAGWDECNTELCEILEGARSIAHSIHEQRVKDWVAANGITPKLPVGQVVKTPHGIGPITRIIPESAIYVVRTDEYLARNPDQTKYSGSGILIPYESCEVAP